MPGNDPLNVVALGRESIKTDSDGHFTTSFVLPDRISDEPQHIRVTISENVGAPRFTQNAKDTWDKIIETVFMALLATTAGTILAFPISFLAARNLMKSVRSPLTSVALSVLGWPIGMGLGYYIVNQIGSLHHTTLGKHIHQSSQCYCNSIHVLVRHPLGFAAGRNKNPHTVFAINTHLCFVHGDTGRILWILPISRAGHQH